MIKAKNERYRFLFGDKLDVDGKKNNLIKENENASRLRMCFGNERFPDIETDTNFEHLLVWTKFFRL